MAMPIGSMVARFREEFEAHIEEARRRSDLATVTPTAPEPAAVLSDTHGPQTPAPAAH
jgi:NADH-quinone oxidoreductase subunit F